MEINNNKPNTLLNKQDSKLINGTNPIVSIAQASFTILSLAIGAACVAAPLIFKGTLLFSTSTFLITGIAIIALSLIISLAVKPLFQKHLNAKVEEITSVLFGDPKEIEKEIKKLKLMNNEEFKQYRPQIIENELKNFEQQKRFLNEQQYNKMKNLLTNELNDISKEDYIEKLKQELIYSENPKQTMIDMISEYNKDPSKFKEMFKMLDDGQDVIEDSEINQIAPTAPIIDDVD